jgi:hypothetical protein
MLLRALKMGAALVNRAARVDEPKSHRTHEAALVETDVRTTIGV